MIEDGPLRFDASERLYAEEKAYDLGFVDFLILGINKNPFSYEFLKVAYNEGFESALNKANDTDNYE